VRLHPTKKFCTIVYFYDSAIGIQEFLFKSQIMGAKVLLRCIYFVLLLVDPKRAVDLLSRMPVRFEL